MLCTFLLFIFIYYSLFTIFYQPDRTKEVIHVLVTFCWPSPATAMHDLFMLLITVYSITVK